MSNSTASAAASSQAHLDPEASDSGVWAIMALFAWLVPHVFITIAEARWEIAKSKKWQGDKLEQGLKSITKNSWISISVAMIIISLTAAGIALGTRGMDVNMLYILSGLSRLASAVIVFIISIRIPRWFGLYHVGRDKFERPIGNCLKVLSFNIRWRIWKRFFEIYFILCPFFSAGLFPSWGIPLAIILGCIGGIIVCLTVYYGRAGRFKARKRCIAISIGSLLLLVSSVAFAMGVWYILVVWNPDASDDDQDFAWILSLFAWLIFGVLIHLLVRTRARSKETERQIKMGQGHDVRSGRYKTAFFHPQHFRGVTADDDNILPPSKTGEDVVASNTTTNPQQQQQQKDDDDDNNNEGAADTNEPPKEGNEQDPEIQEVPDKKEEEDESPENKDASVAGTSGGGGGVVELEEAVAGEEGEEENEEDITTCSLLMGKCCCCCGRCGCTGYKGDATLAEEENIPACEKFFVVLRWTIWILASLCCLYLTIVNIGATVQVDRTRVVLPTVDLYGGMSDGPVCAFQGLDLGGEWNPPYEFETFNNTLTATGAEVAQAKNWTVVHCGACGACSESQIFPIQWNTRQQLATLSRNCAVKSLTGGFDAVLQCHMDSIGFDYDCAKCWTVNIMSTKAHCTFIYLQSLIINSFTNFEVNPESRITSAACDEAFSGSIFLPCAGANRRRMGIVSDIARPEDQQCTLVGDPTWTELWGPCGTKECTKNSKKN